MHLPAPRCFRPLQRTIHLGCRTRSRTIFKHFIFNSLILPRKETSMPSVIANGTQTRLLHGGLQLDFADALCESSSTRTQHKKTSKNHRSSPRILFLPLLRHPCRRCNLPPLNRYALERCLGPLHWHWHHWHLAFLDPGSWVLPPAIWSCFPCFHYFRICRSWVAHLEMFPSNLFQISPYTSSMHPRPCSASRSKRQ